MLSVGLLYRPVSLPPVALHRGTLNVNQRL